MNHCDTNEHLLRMLSAPRRNHFFYGKRMDVQHFRMEQDYGKLKQWLLNRLTLGKGVLCGLRVWIENGMLCVDRGVCIDGLGREIIVPVRTCIDPFAPPSCPRETHAPERDPPDREGPRVVTLWACYRECTTDYMPVLVSECEVRESCAPGTVVESFQLKVTDGAPPVLGDPAWCAKLWGLQPAPHEHEAPTPAPTSMPTPPPAPTPTPAPHDAELDDAMAVFAGDRPEVAAALRSRRKLLCELLGGHCDPPEGDPCVPLAVALLRGKEIARLETCLVQPRVYSNAALLDLILCLAEKIDECCEGHAAPTPAPTAAPTPTPRPTASPTPTPTPRPTPTPSPTPRPTPTPTPAPTLRVKAVEFRSSRDPAFFAALATPQDAPTLPQRAFPSAIVVIFTKELDERTVTTGDDFDLDPRRFSFLVRGSSAHFQDYVPGTLTFPEPHIARFEIHREFSVFGAGEYRVRLSGEADLAAGRPAIAARDRGRLDGEITAAWPTGQNDEGGDFEFRFSVS